MTRVMQTREDEMEDQSGTRVTPGPYKSDISGPISFVIAGDGMTIAIVIRSGRTLEECRHNTVEIVQALNNFDPLRTALRDLLDTLPNHPTDVLIRAAKALASAEGGPVNG